VAANHGDGFCDDQSTQATQSASPRSRRASSSNRFNQAFFRTDIEVSQQKRVLVNVWNIDDTHEGTARTKCSVSISLHKTTNLKTVVTRFFKL